jgi:NodT family efflux transporter outer membrane factor (OMF) lipoprotein
LWHEAATVISQDKTVIATQFKSLSLYLLAALCGCTAGVAFILTEAHAATVFAEPVKAQATVAAPAQPGEEQKYIPAQNIPSELRALFQSPPIDTLIKRSFGTNRNFETAQAALLQAREYTAAQQGFFYPAVGTGNKLAGDKGRNSPGQQGSASPDYYNFHIKQLTVGFVPDVLRANNKQSDSVQAREELQKMQLDATYITLASNLVASAIQEVSLRAQIDSQLNIIGLNRQALEIAHNQFKLGYVSEEDVTQQEMAAALAQQALVPMQQQLDQTRSLLRVLAGDTQNEDIAKDFVEDFDETLTLAALQLSQELPLRLSSRLIEQRPDVRLAETQLRSAAARYGVVVANTLPQFNITADSGGMASSSKWMLKNGGRFFDLKGNAAQTIFGAGKLRAKSHSAQQALTHAAAQYRSVVMVALQNVADALYVIKADALALKATEKVAQTASKKGDLTRKNYEAGSLDFPTLQAAQQNEQLATINLLHAQTNRMGDTVALFQALGGGWWGREARDRAQAKRH